MPPKQALFLTQSAPRKPMWLPTPIYERLPQFWILLGLMFTALGLYIGFDFELIFFYLAVGLLCFARGIWIFLLRLRFREKQKNSDDPAVGDNPDATPVGH
jgi:hypothetical protein